MTRYYCPPDHKHAQTLTCNTLHGCRCTPCRSARNKNARANYAKRRDGIQQEPKWRARCDVCNTTIQRPRVTCPECVEACVDLWRAEKRHGLTQA